MTKQRPPLSDTQFKVSQQAKKFREELPTLLLEHGDEWALYLDGVIEFFDSMSDAYSAGLKRFGIEGGFVVAQVKAQQEIYVPSCWRLVERKDQ